jgi:hypothetical protein
MSINLGYLTGKGSVAIDAVPQVVFDMDVGVTDPGSAHVFDNPTNVRIQHAGWVGLGYGGLSGTGYWEDPTLEITWWSFIEHSYQDLKCGVYPEYVGADTFVYNLELGVEIHVNVSF